jgi:hypothetical protein
MLWLLYFWGKRVVMNNSPFIMSIDGAVTLDCVVMFNIHNCISGMLLILIQSADRAVV